VFLVFFFFFNFKDRGKCFKNSGKRRLGSLQKKRGKKKRLASGPCNRKGQRRKPPPKTEQYMQKCY
jgi:hypothetical protein